MGERPIASYLGGGSYASRLPLVTAGGAAAAESQYATWLWYAARRRGLSLDGAAPTETPAEQVAEELRLDG